MIHLGPKEKAELKKAMAMIKKIGKVHFTSKFTALKSWKGDVAMTELKIFMNETENLFNIGEDKEITRLSLRKHNDEKVTIKVPYVKGIDKNGALRWGTRKDSVIINSFTATMLAGDIINTTDLALPGELLDHMTKQCDILCYRRPWEAVQKGLSSAARIKNKYLCSQKVEADRNLYMLRWEDDVQTDIEDILEAHPRDEFHLDCGVRSTRFITDRFIPYTAILLRQALNVVRGQ